MKYKVGDRVYSKTFKEKGVVDHINISDGKILHWVKPEKNGSCQFVAVSNQVKPIITLRAGLCTNTNTTS